MFRLNHQDAEIWTMEQAYSVQAEKNLTFSDTLSSNEK